MARSTLRRMRLQLRATHNTCLLCPKAAAQHPKSHECPRHSKIVTKLFRGPLNRLQKSPGRPGEACQRSFVLHILVVESDVLGTRRGPCTRGSWVPRHPLGISETSAMPEMVSKAARTSHKRRQISPGYPQHRARYPRDGPGFQDSPGARPWPPR